MKDVRPATPDFIAEKERQEKNRREYLLRKYGADGGCRMQQELLALRAKIKAHRPRRHSPRSARLSTWLAHEC